MTTVGLPAPGAGAERAPGSRGPQSPPPLLEVADLHVSFETPEGTLSAVNGISYSVDKGERLVILGESGSGKTVSVEAVMGILPSPPARVNGVGVFFEGVDLLRLSPRERRKFRGQKMAMVFQDSLTALNPGFPVGDQIAEMYRAHLGMARRDAKKRAVEMLDRVRIPSALSRVDDYPHQFSGGMRQRVMIAVALALDPMLLIADEPTTALDVTVQAQILELLDEISAESGMSLILITHDLGVAAEISDNIVIMYAGKIAESGPTGKLFRRPAHPYTAGLMDSIPRVDQRGKRLLAIRGRPPSLTRIPEGCAFNPRCRFADDICRMEQPLLRAVEDDHASSCHHFEKLGLDV